MLEKSLMQSHFQHQFWQFLTPRRGRGSHWLGATATKRCFQGVCPISMLLPMHMAPSINILGTQMPQSMTFVLGNF